MFSPMRSVPENTLAASVPLIVARRFMFASNTLSTPFSRIRITP